MTTKLVALSKQAPFILCASLFIYSAIAKAHSMAEFEMYIYSFQILPFNLSTLFARFVIASEFALAIFLLFPLKFKTRSVPTILSVAELVAFSIFLCALVLAGREDNCHCMGEAFDLNPVQSLIKNIVAIVILLIGGRICWHKSVSPKFGIIFSAIVLVIASLFVFIWKPADFMRLYKAQKVRTENLNRYLKENPSPTFRSEGKRFVAILSTECVMCKRGAKKLVAFARQNDIDSTRLLKIFTINESLDREESLEMLSDFLGETGLDSLNIRILSSDSLSQIAPKVPTFILLDGDSVVGSRGYKSLLEEDVRTIRKN